VLGDWSPNARYLFFWVGPLGVSVQADGLTPYVLDADTGQSTQVAFAALLNRRYHSWAPDSSALALTAGDYRSAQINKWLVLFNTTTAQATTIISNTEQIPGIVAWSPRGDVIAYAAVSAVQTNDQLADLITWDNPAIAGRRIYLLDPDTGKQGRLNTTESFQDALVWSEDGLTLYYAERQGNDLIVMAANPTTGQAKPVEGTREPLPEFVGYYGQSDLDGLLARRPDSRATPTPTPVSATDQ
jgi:Tol biopolymer transport system component